MTPGLRIASLIILMSFIFGLWALGVVEVINSNASLPGDPWFPLRIRLEHNRIRLTDNSVLQAQLYQEFAGRRLYEMEILLNRRRFGDIAVASGEFVKNIQLAREAIEKLSQVDPVQGYELNKETLSLLRLYSELLSQSFVIIPKNILPVVEENAPAAPPDSSITSDDNYSGAQTSSPEMRSVVLPTMTPMIIILPTSSLANLQSGLIMEGKDATCRGLAGAVTVENLRIPQGASCTLDGTRVHGNIMVEKGASLTAQGANIMGNIQNEGANAVEVLAGSIVGGSIQLKQGGSARVENASVTGDIQFESNSGLLSAVGNQVGGNIQFFQNSGDITIAHNIVNGNLQCKENNQSPGGGNNRVQGNKEDQCAAL